MTETQIIKDVHLMIAQEQGCKRVQVAAIRPMPAASLFHDTISPYVRGKSTKYRKNLSRPEGAEFLVLITQVGRFFAQRAREVGWGLKELR